jgi:biotin synthase
MAIIDRAAEEAVVNEGIDRQTAETLNRLEAPEEIHYLMARANMVRKKFRGDEIELCAIINARSGRCSEDCTFCAQSGHYQAQADVYPLLPTSKILEAAEAARNEGVVRFSIVTSGKGAAAGSDLDRIAEIFSGFGDLGLSPCASLGILTPEAAGKLKEAGLVSYHHNLETSPDYYPRICTTHGIEERMATARLAKAAGFRLCCGGIIGLGEPPESRVNLAFTIKELGADSVPMNFLNPIPGTPLEGQPPLPPMEILKTIALFRLILPRADIRTCGGREKNLRGLQPLMFLAGANATMTGNYLTTTGRGFREDIQDILDLGLRLKTCY